MCDYGINLQPISALLGDINALNQVIWHVFKSQMNLKKKYKKHGNHVILTFFILIFCFFQSISLSQSRRFKPVHFIKKARSIQAHLYRLSHNSMPTTLWGLS